MTKIIYIACAYICVGLGAVGVFVPLLPTTPFLLLALFLFYKSSPESARIILNSKLLNPYVEAYYAKKGIPPNILIRTLVILWGTLVISALFFASSIYVILLLLCVGICVSVFLLINRQK